MSGVGAFVCLFWVGFRNAVVQTLDRQLEKFFHDAMVCALTKAG